MYSNAAVEKIQIWLFLLKVVAQNSELAQSARNPLLLHRSCRWSSSALLEIKFWYASLRNLQKVAE
jgi:hypothetical protein